MSMCALVAKVWPDKVVRWCTDGKFLTIFALRAAFPTSHVQHILDLHPKLAREPHHVWKDGKHQICDG